MTKTLDNLQEIKKMDFIEFGKLIFGNPKIGFSEIYCGDMGYSNSYSEISKLNNPENKK